MGSWRRDLPPPPRSALPPGRGLTLGFYARRPKKVYSRKEEVSTRGGMIQAGKAKMIVYPCSFNLLRY